MYTSREHSQGLCVVAGLLGLFWHGVVFCSRVVFLCLHPCLSVLLQAHPSLIPRPEDAGEEKGPGFSRFVHALRKIIDSLLDDSSRHTNLSVSLCRIPVVLNNATLFLLLTSVRRQAFIADIVILAHKYARCLSSE